VSLKSGDIRNLVIREQKSFKVIDFALSKRCKDIEVRMEAAKFILSRLYPIKTEGKMEHSGDLTIHQLMKEAYANYARGVGISQEN